MRIKILIGLFCTGLSLAYAQAQTPRQFTTNNNAWFMYFGSHKFSKKWGLHAEAQVRRSDGVSDWQQLLLRTGLSYYLTDNAVATAGYCFVNTWPYGEFAAKSRFPENRWWEQIQVKSQVGRLEWINRLRLEQRFVHSPVQEPDGSYAAGDAVYTNRARLLNRVSIPFKGQKIVDKSFYLSVYDEAMVSFGKKVQVNIFDQNRAYAALGYRFPKVGRLELGYMLQTIVKGDGLKIENNRTLMVSLSSNFDLLKKGS